MAATTTGSAPHIAPEHWTWHTALRDRLSIQDLERVMATEQHEGEVCRAGVRALEEENARLRSVLGHCPKSIAVLDEQGCLVGYNREFRALFDDAPQLGEPIARHFEPTDAAILADVIAAAGTSQRRGALLRLGEGDDHRRVEFLVATLPWAEGGSIGVVLAGEDRSHELAHVDDYRAVVEANYVGAFGMAEALVQADVGAAQTSALAALRALTAEDVVGRTLGDPEIRGRLDAAIDALKQGAKALDRLRVTDGKRVGAADVRQSAHRAARLVSPGFCRHHLYLDVRVPEGLLAAIDPSDLTQVISNVLSNAMHSIEQARRPGHIEVWAEHLVDGSGKILLHVRDDGVGIDPSRIVSAFDPFETSRGERGGVGLGLAIARRIVEATGGSMKLLSEVDRGTEVMIELAPAAS